MTSINPANTRSVNSSRERAGVAQTDRPAVLENVRYPQNFGIARQLELVQYVDLQWPKAPAKCNLLCRRDPDLAKHQDVMVQVGTM